MKILVPLLENGSLEEDEDMIERWATLLANAINPNHTGGVNIGYLDVLRQLSPKDALVLDKLFEYYNQKLEEGKKDGDVDFHPTIAQVKTLFGLERKIWWESISNLFRLGLVTTSGVPLVRQSSDSIDNSHLILNEYAFKFVKTCKIVSGK
jgi:hypothetical protein